MLTYLLADHLGSNSLITSDLGTLLSETRYKPFGEIRYATGTTTTPYTYTGQYSNTADFGWMYYKARWYDPYLNRWTQPDTIIPDPSNPQDWNRYTYARNNPVKYNDPSGHDVGCGGRNADCSPLYPETNDRDRQNYLFSLVFLGSGNNGKWTREDWIYYNAHSEIMVNPSQWKNPDPDTGKKGFVLHTERLASNYDQTEKDQFVKDFALLFGGIATVKYPNNITAAWDVRGGPNNGSEHLGFLNESNHGLSPIYKDISTGSNQSHHYTGLFFAGYSGSKIAGYIAGAIRDRANPGDIMLGDQAARDGDWFRWWGVLRMYLAWLVNYGDRRPWEMKNDAQDNPSDNNCIIVAFNNNLGN